MGNVRYTGIQLSPSYHSPKLLMFDSILYTASSAPSPLIDAGALAESLIFYGKVKVVGNTAVSKELTRRIPPFELLSLLRQGRLEIHYLGDQIGVSSTPTSNSSVLHNLVRFSSPDHTIEKVAIKIFQAATGHSGAGILGASEFENLLNPLDHSEFDQVSILNALTDKRATNDIAKAIIRSVAPNYAEIDQARFEIDQSKQGLVVITDIDFARVNDEYHRIVPPEHSTINQAHVISRLQSAYATAYFAGSLESEIAVSEGGRVICAKTINAVVNRSEINVNQVEKFLDVTLGDGRAIREAINSGEVKFSSILKLLEEADKFRCWIAKQPANADLLRAFYQETIKDSWAEKLPAKPIRFSVFTALGLAADAVITGGLGTLAGIGMGAVDSFLVDRLIKGWKPHQFVKGSLEPLFLRHTAKKGFKGFRKN
jgi:hypothetical protein